MRASMLAPSTLVEVALRLLAPPACAACDERLARDAVFCQACAHAVAPAARIHPRAFAAAAYGGPVAEAIVRFKYKGRTDLARPLAHLVAPVLVAVRALDEIDEIDVVVPVPLHPARLRERGYNQAALVARPIARRLGATFEPFALERVRATPPQASLAADARAANVATAFRCARPHAIAQRGVLIVDDVRTTGATLDACAHAIDGVGARSVHFLTIAQS